LPKTEAVDRQGRAARLPVGENVEDDRPTLDGLATEGARRMIVAAFEAEVGEYVASLVDEVDGAASSLARGGGSTRLVVDPVRHLMRRGGRRVVRSDTSTADRR
jgi:hypothetical protein